MMVHVLSGCWPFPGEAVRTNPSNPNDLIAVSEFDRRETSIKRIKHTHPLMSSIRQCLSNSPSLRPTASEVHQLVNTVAADNPPSFANRAEMLEKIKVLRMGKKTMKIEKVTLSSQVEKMCKEISNLRDANEALLISRCESLMKERDHTSDTRMDWDFFSQGVLISCSECAVTRLSIAVNKSDVCTNRAVYIGKGAYILYTRHRIVRPSFASILASTLVSSEAAAVAIGIGAAVGVVGGVGAAVGGVVGASALLTALSGASGQRVVSTSGMIHYDCDTTAWRSLPLPRSVNNYNLGHLLDKLLLVGGRETPNIYEFNEKSQEWVMSTTIPPMPTARSLATVASWTTPEASALIVCGGTDSKSNTSAAVEVYHSVTSQWHTAASLPYPRHNVRHVIIHNTLYVVGEDEVTHKCSVFSVSIIELIESCLQQPPPDQESKWQTLPDIPSVDCFLATLKGHLLAVEQQKATVYIYCPAFSSWVQLGNLPFPRIQPTQVETIITVSAVNSDELLIVKSRTANNESSTVSMCLSAHKVRLSMSQRHLV